jgi:hypothetical protein
MRATHYAMTLMISFQIFIKFTRLTRESVQRTKVTVDCVSVVVALISYKCITLPITLIIIQYHFARQYIHFSAAFAFILAIFLLVITCHTTQTRRSIDRYTLMCISFTLSASQSSQLAMKIN